MKHIDNCNYENRIKGLHIGCMCDCHEIHPTANNLETILKEFDDNRGSFEIGDAGMYTSTDWEKIKSFLTHTYNAGREEGFKDGIDHQIEEAIITAEGAREIERNKIVKMIKEMLEKNYCSDPGADEISAVLETLKNKILKR